MMQTVKMLFANSYRGYKMISIIFIVEFSRWLLKAGL